MTLLTIKPSCLWKTAFNQWWGKLNKYPMTLSCKNVIGNSVKTTFTGCIVISQSWNNCGGKISPNRWADAWPDQYSPWDFPSESHSHTDFRVKTCSFPWFTETSSFQKKEKKEKKRVMTFFLMARHQRLLQQNFGCPWIISTSWPLTQQLEPQVDLHSQSREFESQNISLLVLQRKGNRKMQRKGNLSSLVISANTYPHVHTHVCLWYAFLLKYKPSISRVDYLFAFLSLHISHHHWAGLRNGKAKNFFRSLTFDECQNQG